MHDAGKVSRGQGWSIKTKDGMKFCYPVKDEEISAW